MAETIQAVPEKERVWLSRDLFETHEISRMEAAIIGRTLQASARDFEFMPASRRVTPDDPPALILREIRPRQFPDGRRARYYGFTDGRIEEVVSADGNFSDWESRARRGVIEQ